MKSLVYIFITATCLAFITPNSKCMEKDTGTLLTSEVPSEITPETRGLGFLWASKTLLWNKRDLFLSNLVNNTVDIKNASNQNVFNTSINEFVDNNEDEKLITVINSSYEKFKGLLKPRNVESQKAHIYLIKIGATKREALKETVTSYHEKITTELNKRIFNLKTVLADEIKGIEDYLQDEEKKVNTECDKLREIKKALLLIHTMNQDFKLPQLPDGYCSDTDEMKKTKNPSSINTFYSNETLFKKITINITHQGVLANINKNIKALKDGQETINKIPLLAYKKKL